MYDNHDLDYLYYDYDCSTTCAKLQQLMDGLALLPLIPIMQ